MDRDREDNNVSREERIEFVIPTATAESRIIQFLLNARQVNLALADQNLQDIKQAASLSEGNLATVYERIEDLAQLGARFRESEEGFNEIVDLVLNHYFAKGQGTPLPDMSGSGLVVEAGQPVIEEVPVQLLHNGNTKEEVGDEKALFVSGQITMPSGEEWRGFIGNEKLGSEGNFKERIRKVVVSLQSQFPGRFINDSSEAMDWESAIERVGQLSVAELRAAFNSKDEKTMPSTAKALFLVSRSILPEEFYAPQYFNALASGIRDGEVPGDLTITDVVRKVVGGERVDETKKSPPVATPPEEPEKRKRQYRKDNFWPSLLGAELAADSEFMDAMRYTVKVVVEKLGDKFAEARTSEGISLKPAIKVLCELTVGELNEVFSPQNRLTAVSTAKILFLVAQQSISNASFKPEDFNNLGDLIRGKSFVDKFLVEDVIRRYLDDLGSAPPPPPGPPPPRKDPIPDIKPQQPNSGQDKHYHVQATRDFYMAIDAIGERADEEVHWPADVQTAAKLLGVEELILMTLWDAGVFRPSDGEPRYTLFDLARLEILPKAMKADLLTASKSQVELYLTRYTERAFNDAKERRSDEESVYTKR